MEVKKIPATPVYNSDSRSNSPEWYTHKSWQTSFFAADWERVRANKAILSPSLPAAYTHATFLCKYAVDFEAAFHFQAR